ncbi:MAG: TonB family protein [Polaromonas sp.]|nr:TonB family protein [Polaromonas sp.]
MQTIYRQRDLIGAASAALMLGTVLLALAAPVMEKTIIAAAEVTLLQLSEPEPEKKVVPVQPKPVTSVRPPPIAALPAPSQSSVKADAPSPTSVVASLVSKAVSTEAAPSAAVSPVATPQVVPTKMAEPLRQAPPPAVTQTVVQTERYEAQILRYLESIKRYPSSREARQTRPSGTVTVWFDLSRAGRVLAAGIEKSSNSSLLDSEALKTVRTGNFPVYPEGVFASADMHRFSAHLSYELKTTE